ncbi:MAG: hypothetical protein JO067_02685 [Cupriavidus sp.]|nr:hypothetical protein [Cupriavidus sp.]
MPPAPARGKQPAGNGGNGYCKRGQRKARRADIVSRAALFDIGWRSAGILLPMSLQVSERMDDRRRLPEQQEQNQQDRQPALPHG